MSREELLSVFKACDPDEDGFISLENLANISRSHVDSSQVDKIREIFNTQHKDRVDFREFCQQIYNYMSQVQDNGEEAAVKDRTEDGEDSVIKPTEGEVQQDGVNAVEDTGHNGMQLGSRLNSPRKKMKRMSKNARTSQTRLSGAIPLVNTSSEDDNDLEDSFDRQIAASLEFAGKQLESRQKATRFLVRGSNIRSTVRSKTRLSLGAEDLRQSTISPIAPRKDINEETVEIVVQPEDKVISPIEARRGPTEAEDLDWLNSSESSNPSKQSSPIPDESLFPRSTLTRVVEGREDVSITRSILEGLEQKIGELGNHGVRSDYCLSPAKAIDLKVELESQMEKMRIESRERVDELKERHREEIRAIDKERYLEKTNFQLRLDQIQEEVSRLRKDKAEVEEKVRLLYIEKEMAEEVSRMSIESDRTENNPPIPENYNHEYLSKIQDLVSRIQEQDDQIIELKEDNLVLRNQKTALLEANKGENLKFRRFLGRNPTTDSLILPGLDTDDPQDLRVRMQFMHKQLGEQKEINKQLKAYLDDVLINILSKNPEILEKH